MPEQRPCWNAMAETSDISDGFIKKAAFAILILPDSQHILFACVAECYQTRYILSITQLKICRRSSACISRPASRELKESSDDLQHLCTAGPQELLRRAMRSSPCPVTPNGNIKHRKKDHARVKCSWYSSAPDLLSVGSVRKRRSYWSQCR